MPRRRLTEPDGRKHTNILISTPRHAHSQTRKRENERKRERERES